MTSGGQDQEEEKRAARDARNEEIFNSRFTRVDQVIKPWLKKAGAESEANAIVDLNLSGASKEVKEEHLLRTVQGLLDIALPSKDLQGNVDASLSADSSAGPASTAPRSFVPPSSVGHHPIYATLQLNKNANEEQQIRLLELLPRSKADEPDGGDIINATMFCVSNPEDKEYEALSYTWGPNNPKHRIIVNGQPFDVGTNLHNALVSLRRPDSPRLLWVDALCTNQADEKEKTTQVALMNAIYRQAQNVLVFLGMTTCPEKSYALFDFLERQERVDDVTQENLEEIIEECRFNKTSIIASFIEFCDREWWTRVWVMQEYYLSTRPVIWYIGSRGVGGEKLIRDVRGLAMTTIGMALPFKETDDDLPAEMLGNYTTGSLWARMFKICDGVLQRLGTNPYHTPRLLFAKPGRNATDAKDYVFGVRELLEPHFRQVFVPDYGLGQGKLFEKLAAWLLLMDGWGDILWYYPFRTAYSDVDPGSRGGMVEFDQLPSWVPDFTQRPEQLYNEPAPPRFSSDDPKTVHCAIVDRVLYIDGCRLDTIQEIIPMPGEGSGCFEVLQKMWQLDRIFCSDQLGDKSSLPSRTVYTDHDRESCALMAWANTTRPATLPLAPRWREMWLMITPHLNIYADEITARFQREADEGRAKSKASPESAQTQEWYVKEAAIAARHGKQTHGVNNLHEFLCGKMECDFTSACVFDFENIDSQLHFMREYSNDVEEGLRLLLSRYGPRETIYADLIRAIQASSDPDDSATFWGLVDVVRGIAKKIHQKVVSASGNVSHSSEDQASEENPTIAGLRKLLEPMKVRVEKLEEGDKIDNGSFATDDSGIKDKNRYIQSLKTQVEKVEGLLEGWLRKEARDNRLRGPNNRGWTRIHEERAAQLRGRQFFATKAGLFGVACPDVDEVKVGDQVVLLDGVSFPVIARGRGGGGGGPKLSVVGCANIRGVTPRHVVEDVDLRANVTLGPKQTLAFV